jgi:hypothetical protein
MALVLVGHGIVHQVPEVERDVDDRPEEGLGDQQHEAPDLVGRVVDAWREIKRSIKIR